MMDRDQVYEAMEACRPGEDDLALPELGLLAQELQRDPELRRRFERLQQADRAIRDAFRRVPVPEGLEGRLLSRLAEENARQPAESAVDRPAPAPHAVTRRQVVWRVGLSLAAMAAAVVVGVFYFTPKDIPSLGPRDLIGCVDDIQNSLDDAAWQVDPEVATPEDYPPSRHVLVPVHRWQRVATPFDAQTVVYDVTPRNGPESILAVLRPQGEVYGFPSGPPGRPQSTTGGRSIAVWQHESLVYLLAIEGDDHEAAYHRMTDAGGPVALLLRPGVFASR